MIVHCALCGEELTAPQFYKGKPYGWSCIKKVDPKAKKQTVQGFEKFTVVRPVVGREHILRCVVEYCGKKVMVTGEVHSDVLWVTKTQLKKF